MHPAYRFLWMDLSYTIERPVWCNTCFVSMMWKQSGFWLLLCFDYMCHNYPILGISSFSCIWKLILITIYSTLLSTIICMFSHVLLNSHIISSGVFQSFHIVKTPSRRRTEAPELVCPGFQRIKPNHQIT